MLQINNRLQSENGDILKTSVTKCKTRENLDAVGLALFAFPLLYNHFPVFSELSSVYAPFVSIFKIQNLNLKSRYVTPLFARH